MLSASPKDPRTYPLGSRVFCLRFPKEVFIFSSADRSLASCCELVGRYATVDTVVRKQIAEGYTQGEEMSSIITVPVQFKAEDFWSEIMGSAWESWDWWVTLDYSEGADWDKVGEITVTSWDGEGECEEDGTLTKTLTIQDLAEAYGKCLAEGCRINIHDLDACQGDQILQMAMFGEIVYG